MFIKAFCENIVVSILLSVATIGFYFSVLPGVIHERCGPRVVTAIGTLIVIGSNTALWATFPHAEFFNTYFIIFVILMFLLGMLFSVIISVNHDDHYNIYCNINYYLLNDFDF